MQSLQFTLTQEQYNALSGLAYRIADNAYMLERYGAKDSEIERAENHKTITGLFDQLDALRVPFWVQNTIICAFENWRRYKTEYVYQVLECRGVDCSAVHVR